MEQKFVNLLHGRTFIRNCQYICIGFIIIGWIFQPILSVVASIVYLGFCFAEAINIRLLYKIKRELEKQLMSKLGSDKFKEAMDKLKKEVEEYVAKQKEKEQDE